LAPASRLDELSGVIDDVADDVRVHPLVDHVGHGIGATAREECFWVLWRAPGAALTGFRPPQA